MTVAEVGPMSAAQPVGVPLPAGASGAPRGGAPDHRHARGRRP